MLGYYKTMLNTMYDKYLKDLEENNYDSIIFVHGYHGGRALKDLVRKEIEYERIKKILPLDASRTAYILKKI